MNFNHIFCHCNVFFSGFYVDSKYDRIQNVLPDSFLFFENKAVILLLNHFPGTLVQKSFLDILPLTFLYVLILILFLLVILISILFFRFARKKKQLEYLINEKNRELLLEKDNSERLLARVLPKITAEELRKTGRAKTKRYKLVTVLFCDIEGFTRIAEHMNPEALVDKLDTFYFKFDNVVERFNIEKIKTIGDAYMCAGGIPVQNHTNPVEVILAALEMLRYMRELKNSTDTDIWDIRIGIHSGPVIAGVVGQKRLSYDIWGDTVNTASRMESSGEAGLVNISENTYQLVKDFFECEFRGKMPVKYKGKIEMYFVKRIKAGLHEVEEPLVPNAHFNNKLQLLRLEDLEYEVFGLLETFISPGFTYHNLKHTADLYAKTELYATAENNNLEELLILRTAALLSDLNFFENRKKEITSIISTIDLLKKYKYTDNQILLIYQLFDSLKRPLHPKNNLEAIFIDAELDFIGREDCLTVFNELLLESRMENPLLNHRDWWNEKYNFVKQHEFHCFSARELRDVPKDEQLNRLAKNYLTTG